LGEAIQAFRRRRPTRTSASPRSTSSASASADAALNDLAARTFQNAIREKPVFDDEKKELLYELGSVLEKMGKARKPSNNSS